jgi:uncharacterized protein
VNTPADSISQVLNRRELLLAVAGLAASALQGCSSEPARGQLLSAFENARGEHFIGGVELATRQIFGAPVAMRAHGCTPDPVDPQRVMFFARRPGTDGFELRLDTLRARRLFSTGDGRHLAGHGLFSLDGQWLLTPEHDYETPRGVIAVRDSRNGNIAAEIATGGIDPHEIAWLPDGRLLVANGGILTHPRTFRRKLNLASMDPSLCVLELANGTCLEQWRLPDHQLSIRHLAVCSDGSAVAGLQYEGDRRRAPSVVAWYRSGAGLRLLAAAPADRARMQGYVASVLVSESAQLIAAACPFGSGFACWSLQQQHYLGWHGAGEIYGLAQLANGLVMGSNRDGSACSLSGDSLRHWWFDRSEQIRWDDHWVAHDAKA